MKKTNRTNDILDERITSDEYCHHVKNMANGGNGRIVHVFEDLLEKQTVTDFCNGPVS